MMLFIYIHKLNNFNKYLVSTYFPTNFRDTVISFSPLRKISGILIIPLTVRINYSINACSGFH